MPLAKYDKAFGGTAGAAAKARRSMLRQYGREKGEQVFYATMHKKKSLLRRKER